MPVNTPSKEGIHWFEWKSESFQLARILDRPILLDLTAVWCHWCRVMDETSYADLDVVRLANELFVPIRVNVDRRPDISERYNFGGFPTTAVLTPEGETITGGTYISPDELKTWLLSQSEYFRAQRNEIRRRLASFSQASSQLGEGELSEGIVEDVEQCLVENFDRLYGGFGTQPKFPLPDAVKLALDSAQTAGQEIFHRIISKTLDEMAIGGLFDRVDGGFHRFSSTRDWSSPHFEKILEGNAELLSIYVRAYKLTEAERYRKIAEHTLEYMLKTLQDPEKSAFYGSQAADEEYYDLPKDERSRRTPPSIDKTFYTNWNARTIVALIEAASIMREGPKLLSICERLADFLIKDGFDEARGMHHYFDPAPNMVGLLGDNLETASALLELHMTIGDSKYLQRAEGLAGVLMRSFWDRENGGGFCDRAEEKTAEGHLKRPEKNLQENSLAAEFFLDLGAVTGRVEYVDTAKMTLNLFTETYPELGLLASSYAQSVKLAVRGPIRIEIIGPREDPDFQEFLRAASNLLESRRVVVPLDLEEDLDRIRGFYAEPAKETYARVCTDTLCSKPLREPSELKKKVSAAANYQ